MNADARTDKARSAILVRLGVPLAFAYYALLITNGSFDLFHAPERDLVSGVVFNSMLSHLLEGSFAVDPEAIRLEAYVRDGTTYTYFGIFPALLRLPLLPLRNFATLDVTALSMVLAMTLAACCKCASLLLIRRLGNGNSLLTALYGLLIVAVLVGGPQIQFLKPSIYQEVICWAMALSAAFIYTAMRGLLLPQRFSATVLATLAGVAGLALLTRVTAGIALYAALLLLLTSLASRECRFGGTGNALSVAQWLTSRRLLASLFVLAGFAVVCALVNYGRWGSPFVFADIHLNQLMVGGRMVVLDNNGEFNLRRLPFSLLYYFFPLGYWRWADGEFFFGSFRARYYDGVELPPSSFFVSDPVTLILAVTFFAVLIRRKAVEGLDLRLAGAVLAGLAIPVGLILTYYFLAFRFRGEFYPFLEFAAFLGFYAVSRPSFDASAAKWRTEKAVSYGAIVGIVASHLLLVAYKLSPFQSEQFVANGWRTAYLPALREWMTTLRDIW